MTASSTAQLQLTGVYEQFAKYLPVAWTNRNGREKLLNGKGHSTRNAILFGKYDDWNYLFIKSAPQARVWYA